MLPEQGWSALLTHRCGSPHQSSFSTNEDFSYALLESLGQPHIDAVSMLSNDRLEQYSYTCYRISRGCVSYLGVTPTESWTIIGTTCLPTFPSSSYRHLTHVSRY